MTTRRDFIRAAVAGAITVGSGAAQAIPPRLGWQATGLQPGFYPSGHWLASPTGQSLTQIYPQSSSGASAPASYARHLYAYWDGTNDVEYSVPIGVAFGAYPYVFTLLSGPPGMSIAQGIYNGFQNANYGRVIWHPQGNISSSYSGTVSVLVTDQLGNTLTISWTLQTCGQWTAGNGFGYIFVNGTTGNDSNSGSFSSPLATLGVVSGTAGAFGSTFAASTYPGAIVCITDSGTYTLPAFADNGNQFQFKNTLKPAALTVLQGKTPIITTTTGTTAAMVINGQSDVFLQGLTCNSYNSGVNNFRLVYIGGTGTNNSRLTFDSLTWTNGGFGSVGTDNCSMIVSEGGTTNAQYTFMTDCVDSGRQSGTPGNNFGGCDFYSTQYTLVQRCSATGSGSVDAAFWLKSDNLNSTIRECYVNYTSGCSRPFVTTIQNQYSISQLNESCYNLGINVNQIANPEGGGFTQGSMAVYRCSVISGTALGLQCVSTAESCNVEGPALISATPTTGTGSLAAGTYYYRATGVGVSGESTGRYGGGAGVAGGTSLVAGGSNEISATLSATGKIVLSLSTVPQASSINIYRGNAGAGSENQFINVANTTTSFTDDGTGSWTAGTIPAAPGNAVSTSRFSFQNNAVQTTGYVAPAGATVSISGNLIDNTGTIMSATTGQIPSNNANYGLVGFQIA